MPNRAKIFLVEMILIFVILIASSMAMTLEAPVSIRIAGGILAATAALTFAIMRFVAKRREE